MIQALCPASCGELIQGWIHGSEKLISYSINCYSLVSLTEGRRQESNSLTKAYKMINKVFEYYKVPSRQSKGLKLEKQSYIPVGKGMASSTADLAATALATAAYLGKKISQAEIASLCVEIEPTDSIIFSDITLFDHLQGAFIKHYGSNPEGKLLLLEGRQAIDTIEFRRTKMTTILKEQGPKLQKALQLFEEGVKTQDFKKMAEAATISSLANQAILYKDGLEEIIELSCNMGAFGVNIAHSGSVVGILYEDRYFDQEAFIRLIKGKEYFIKNYESIQQYEMVQGGAVLI
ncbi:GHMP family kinase ATP-binding protein [Alkaliphilus peptidifermentans]|uniref:Threonine kinase n=1 Tax=Alkaliphilus peptidifermentans DSM 18978 TaxID=1120976 RepID=A0A1G5AQV2_9FIRM|nr:hypothetical protein [Alkaliphilus peptidifermentans]SCX80283.1 threonine kinase [Alkaliphilus peptidifermentans DSM 18978]